jgi:hypothetical protein
LIGSFILPSASPLFSHMGINQPRLISYPTLFIELQLTYVMKTLLN